MSSVGHFKVRVRRFREAQWDSGAFAPAYVRGHGRLQVHRATQIVHDTQDATQFRQIALRDPFEVRNSPEAPIFDLVCAEHAGMHEDIDGSDEVFRGQYRDHGALDAREERIGAIFLAWNGRLFVHGAFGGDGRGCCLRFFLAHDGEVQRDERVCKEERRRGKVMALEGSNEPPLKSCSTTTNRRDGGAYHVCPTSLGSGHRKPKGAKSLAGTSATKAS